MTAVEHKKGYDVKGEALAAAGKLCREWAEAQMPVLRLIRERFVKEKPLTGVRIAACLHVQTGIWAASGSSRSWPTSTLASTAAGHARRTGFLHYRLRCYADGV